MAGKCTGKIIDTWRLSEKMVVIKVMVEVVKIILVYVPQYCLDDN